jgi:hypothetical protein
MDDSGSVCEGGGGRAVVGAWDFVGRERERKGHALHTHITLPSFFPSRVSLPQEKEEIGPENVLVETCSVLGVNVELCLILLPITALIER